MTRTLQRTTSQQLDQKRYVAAGKRAYVIGVTDGTFKPMGWHIEKRMGGVWFPPLRLLDGYSFAVNDYAFPSAIAFTSGMGFVQFTYPNVGAISLQRLEFSPDEYHAVLVQLRVINEAEMAQTVVLRLNLVFDMLKSFPWRSQQVGYQGIFDLPEISFDPVTLKFAVPKLNWYGGVSGDFSPIDGNTLIWQSLMKAGERRSLWVAVSGSHVSEQTVEETLTAVLQSPDDLLQAKIAARQSLYMQTSVLLPDPSIQEAFDWAKQNLADLSLTVSNFAVRDVDRGRTYPEPLATLTEVSGLAAGFPDYPSYFATDGCYSIFSLIAVGQWQTAMDHLRTIKKASQLVNGDTGKVIHEVTSDGSVYFGNLTHHGNTNETAQFAIAAALVWRWTGSSEWLREVYDFVHQGLRYLMTVLNPYNDDYPVGNGMVELKNMGEQTLDVTVYTWLALYVLEYMARYQEDSETAEWAAQKASSIEQRFDTDWWMPNEFLYGNSRTHNAGAMVNYHWTVATPLEAALAPFDHALLVSQRLSSSEFSSDLGLHHTGNSERKAWTLPTSVLAVGAGMYHQIEQSVACMRAIASQLDVEMPGALPEIAHGGAYNAYDDFSKRAMFMQAWSSYGIHWPIIRHLAGIDADVPAKRIRITPQLPRTWPQLKVDNLRIGDGLLTLSIQQTEDIFSLNVSFVDGFVLTLGYWLVGEKIIDKIELNNRVTDYYIVSTRVGKYLAVDTSSTTLQTLTIYLRDPKRQKPVGVTH